MNSFQYRSLSVFVFLTSFIIVSCNGSNNAADTNDTTTELASTDNSTEATNLYPSIQKAKTHHITYHMADCSRNNKGKICIAICHRPPGNPNNSKTLILPLEATLAHLKHGHSKSPDTIGPCPPPTDNHNGDSCNNDDGGSSGGGNDGSTGGGSSDDGSTSGGSSDDGSTSGGGSDDGSTSGGSSDDGGTITIPDWCLIKYEFDKNCDGFDDTTGESLY